MKRRFATAATAIKVASGSAVLVLALTSCSDDNGEQTEAWAKNVCDQVQPQVERIQGANAAIAEASEGDGDPADVQEVYSESYQELADAFGALAGAVDDAGDPPVDDGEQLKTDAVAELNGLAASYSDLKTASDELDTSDRGAFAEGLREMVDQLEELGNSGDEALGKLQSGDLGEAMARQKGCQSPLPTPSEDGATDGATDEATDEAAEGAEAGDGAEAGAEAGQDSEDAAEDTDDAN